MPAHQIASLIHEGFDTFYAAFMRLTRGARRYFDADDWLQLQEHQQRRIDLYQQYVGRTLASLTPLTSRYPQDMKLWEQAHEIYAGLAAPRIDVEVAETFFNAITRKIFNTEGVHPAIEFLDNDLQRHALHPSPGLCRTIEWSDDLEDVLEEVLWAPRPALRWRDRKGDVRWLAQKLRERCPQLCQPGAAERIEVVKTLFFRPKEGYVVARIIGPEAIGPKGVMPLVIPVRSSSDGMVVDGALLCEAEVMPVFSATRSYLFIDVRKPSELTEFLGSLMPQLSLSELYIAIAHHRHGKSLIYRELVDHLLHFHDDMIIAPGVRGLVMTVFTQKSYRNVFKLIRDRPEKSGMTREHVLGSYRDVFRGQRVGRLADTQEFEFLTFERSRFEESCLAELQQKAPSLVHVRGDQVVIDHLYIEEKMTPLDIFLAQAELSQAQEAIIDYGTAIKELAAHNIFAGDLLWKNFGVDRFGRLVLYDYDEIRPLPECNFRRVPPPRSYEDEMSATPYYSVRENDVFPEEWLPFVAPRRPAALRDAFLDEHADLFTPEFWRGVQEDVLAGRVRVNLPYVPRPDAIDP